MAFGKSMTRNINVADMNDEYAVFAWWKPYVMMLSGAGIVFFGIGLIRLIMGFQYHVLDKLPNVAFWNWGIVVCGIIAAIFVYKFYHRRGEQGNEVLIRFHPTASTVLGVIWMLIALNENQPGWMFGEISLGLFILGASLIMFTWAMRRMSFKNFQNNEPQQINDWGALGLGEQTVAMGSVPVTGGHKIKVKLDPKVTAQDLMDKIVLVAKKLKAPVQNIRIKEESEDPNYAYIIRLDEKPFSTVVNWKGPDKPGTSIAKPIEFATYDTGERACLYLSGKDGDSCFSWLTTGMPGSGKTFAWQLIYESVLARKEVSLVWVDASKAYTSAMPLLSGIEWFAGDMETAHEVIEGVDRAIEPRMKYLASKGYTYWKPGCGLNFIILHVEEASDFLKTESESVLRHIARAGRSAGVIVVYSLQRATNDNMPITLRSLLEGKMAFKIGKKTDRPFCLSDKQLGAGAAPEMISVKGGFYFDSIYEPEELAGNMVRTDWMDEKELERSVDTYAVHRTPLDNVTASAFGRAYDRYCAEVANGTTEWQKVRANRTFDIKNDDTVEYQNIKTESIKNNRSQNFTSNPVEELDKLYEFIKNQGLETFKKKDIADPHMRMTGKNNRKTIYDRIEKLVDQGRLANIGNDTYKIV
jgi:hypothetical protein